MGTLQEKVLNTLKEKANFCRLVLKEGNHPEIQIAQFQGMCEMAEIMGINKDQLNKIKAII